MHLGKLHGNHGKEKENIDFLTFGEVLNRVEKQTKKRVSFASFKLWAYWHKIKEVEKYYEEFNGILTGSHEYAYLNKSSYMELGIKQSLFSKEERATVYLFFQKSDARIEKRERRYINNLHSLFFIKAGLKHALIN